MKVEIEEKDLLDLIHWARRYCDYRSTYAPSSFNQLYDKIVHFNPSIKDEDEFDPTLMDEGKFFPYAQDGHYDPKTGSYDALPKNYIKE